jgi:hypothetical protein
VVSLPTSLIDGWIAGANHGILFMPVAAGDRSVLLVSREGTSAKRPSLRVIYLPPLP